MQQTIFVGISGKVMPENVLIENGMPLDSDRVVIDLAFAYYDGHFNLDLSRQILECVCALNNHESHSVMENAIVSQLREYTRKNLLKIVGAGVDKDLIHYCKRLPQALWFQMDIVPLIVDVQRTGPIEERADSASRKCAMRFGIDGLPRLIVEGTRNEVLVDQNCIQLARLEDYRKTVPVNVWNTTTTLARRIVAKKLRISFFNATPQGGNDVFFGRSMYAHSVKGGVALMRHSLIRFLRLFNIDASWFVPKPNPRVFRITKNVHNILQDVAGDVKFTISDQLEYEEWIRSNCDRYWMNGPFLSSDIIVIDDPQVVGLIPFIKRVNPNARLIYRSHIEIRSEAITKHDSQQQRVWNYLWQHIRYCDLFISHPVHEFVPDCVPWERVRFLPASTDFLDGLNKEISTEDETFYMQMFTRLCASQQDHLITRNYVIQICRFDPSKGIEDVLNAYELFRNHFPPLDEPPQLLVCGHGSVDDPDGTIVFNQVMETIQESKFSFIGQDICLVRLPPHDVLLNVLLRRADVVLQLSKREGFEIKVTEALAKGKPVIAYDTGGLRLQFKHGNGGYLVQPGDTHEVALLLYKLFSNPTLLKEQSKLAKAAVCRQFSTVWNATSWLWIFDQLTNNQNDCTLSIHPNPWICKEWLDAKLDVD